MLNNIIKKIDEGKLNSIFILITVFSFPVIALVNYLFEVKLGYVSKSFRVFNMVFSFYLIYRFIVKLKFDFTLFKKAIKKYYYIALFFLFLIFYLVRLVFDLEVYHINEITVIPSAKNYFYLYAIGVTFIPMIAAFTITKLDFNFLKIYLYRYLITLNTLLIIIFFVERFINNQTGYRFIVTKNEVEYFNAISIAVNGGLLVIMSFLNISKSKFNYILIGVGFFLILTTASRGPILSILISLIFILIFKDKKINIKYLYLTFVMAGTVLVNYLMTLFFSDYFIAGNAFFHRLNNLNDDQSTISRLKITKDAFSQILDSPIFGSHFLVIESKMYSHNILLDILISTGLLGVLLIIPIYLFFAKNIIYKVPYTYITVIGFFYFLNTMTSGSIYNNYEFWIIFAVIIGYQSKHYKTKLIK